MPPKRSKPGRSARCSATRVGAQRDGWLALAAPGVIGLWSLGFFTPDLIQTVLDETFKAEGMPASEIPGNKMIWTGIGFTVMNIGCFFGVYSFSYLTQWLGAGRHLRWPLSARW